MQARHNGTRLAALFVLAATMLLSGMPAFAGYPDRVIRIIVPFAPGGGTDAIARVLAQEMAKDLGGSIIIENKPGAGTIIGAQAVAAAEGDGYTLLMGTFAHAVNPSLNAKLPFDPNKDFAPVALVARSPNIVVVNPKSSFRSVADLIAAAKAEPDKISYGTFGTGTSCRRDVQAHGWGQHDHGPLQGLRARHHRPDRRADPGDVHDGGKRGVPDRGRSVARAGGDHSGTLARLSAFADGRRNRSSRL
jgi:hypothetical protein